MKAVFLRRAAAWVVWMAVPAMLAAAEKAEKPEQAEKSARYTLESSRAVGAIDRVEALLEVTGRLKVADASDPGNGKPTLLPMRVEAKLHYAEKSLETSSKPDGALRSVRHYEKAQAAIRVADDETQPTLRDDRRLIAVRVNEGKPVLFSPRGMLTREELDLIDPLGNSLLVERLLPNRPVAIGDDWQHADALIAGLCGLDSVTKNDVRSTLVSVVDDSAKMELFGRVEGVVGGLNTTVDLKAKYRFSTKTRRVTWFGFLVKEDRRPGLVGPGLDVTARLQMKIGPQDASEALRESALADLRLEPNDELQQLSYAFSSSDGAWELAHDRKWIVIRESEGGAVLRMIEGGDYVAQCSISRAPGEKNPTMDSFREDIRKALGKNFGQFVRTSETPGEHGYRQWRAEVEGVVSDVPISWIYYLITDPAGRRVVVLFTVEGEMRERFKEIDRPLVRTLRLSDPKVAAKPAPLPDAKVRD